MEKIDREEFTKLWNDNNISRVEIARHFGVSTPKTRRLAVKYGLNRRRAYRSAHANRPQDPSPAEIARLCEAIQAGWGESRFERQCLARPRMYD